MCHCERSEAISRPQMQAMVGIASSLRSYLENRLFVGQVANLSDACFHALR